MGSYFLGFNLLRNKKLQKALCSIYGIGSNRAGYICKKLGFQSNIRFGDLNKSQMLLLKRFIETNYKIGFDLKQDIRNNIQNLMDIRSYKGNRHKRGFPVRGQRTKTNAKNCKSKKF